MSWVGTPGFLGAISLKGCYSILMKNPFLARGQEVINPGGKYGIFAADSEGESG